MPNIIECFTPSGTVKVAEFESHYLTAATEIPEVNTSTDTWSKPYISDVGLTGSGYSVQDGYIKNIITNPFGQNVWNQSAGALPGDSALANMAVFAYDSYVYTMGSYDNSANKGTRIYRKSVSDFLAGSGIWNVYGELPYADMWNATALIDEINVYLLGGSSTAMPLFTDIIQLPLAKLETGTTVSGDWNKNFGKLPVAELSGANAVLINDTVCLLGGVNSGGIFQNIYKLSLTTLQSGNTLATDWVDNGLLPTPAGAKGISAIIAESNMIIMGGYNTSRYTQIYKMPISDFMAGTGSWDNGGALPSNEMRESASLVIENIVHCIGGNDNSGRFSQVKSQPIGAILNIDVTNPSWNTSRTDGQAKLYVLIENTDSFEVDMGSNHQLELYISTNDGDTFTEQGIVKRTDIFTSGFINACWYETSVFSVNNQTGIVSQIKTNKGTLKNNPNIKIYHACMAIFDENTEFCLPRFKLYEQLLISMSHRFADVENSDTWYSFPFTNSIGLSLNNATVQDGYASNTSSETIVNSMSIEMPEFNPEQTAGSAKVFIMAKDLNKPMSETVNNDQIRLLQSINNGGDFIQLGLAVRDDLDSETVDGAKWLESDVYSIDGQSGLISKIISQNGILADNPNLRIYHFNNIIMSD